MLLLPGDPGRAARVAEQLQSAHCYNEFRGLLGYTGTYKSTPVSVQTSGMGAPSAAIVVEELALLGAKTVVRIGTCGGTRPDILPTDLIVATAACPLDGTSRQYLDGTAYAPAATFRIVRALVEAAESSATRLAASAMLPQPPFFWTFAQVSRRLTVRLKISRFPDESGSTQK